MHHLELFTALHQQHLQELRQETEQDRLWREMRKNHHRNGHQVTLWWNVREDIIHWWKQAVLRKMLVPVTGKEVCFPCY